MNPAARHSAVYAGVLTHHRTAVREHRFDVRLFMVLLDLDELPALFDGVPGWSARRPALAWFRRRDFLDGADTPLADAARDLVAARTGLRPAGPVRVLTHLRYFGYQINPLRIYWLYGADGVTVQAVIAEVTNTPWGERHCYVLPAPPPDAHGRLRLRFDKALHVSPFMPMDQHYEWLLDTPGERLGTTLACVRDGRVTFTAALALERRPATRAGLLRALARHPFMTARVVLAIYAHAARLRAKGVPFHPHPQKRETTT